MLVLIGSICFVLVTQLVAEQHILGKDGAKTRSQNITFTFDELETSASSGIGFTPSSHSPAVPYHDLFLHSFTLVNTPVAMNQIGSKDNPMLDKRDISCAISAPNALFGSLSALTPGQSYPRISLHNLSSPYSADTSTTNTLFNVLSISMAPVGYIPFNYYSFINVKMLRLPRTSDGFPFPPILKGQPLLSAYGVGYSSLVFVLGPGYRPSRPLRLKNFFGPGYATGLDTIEIDAAVRELDPKARKWGPSEDSGFCLDDLELEMEEIDDEAANQFDAEPAAAAGTFSFVYFTDSDVTRGLGYITGYADNLEYIADVVLSIDEIDRVRGSAREPSTYP